MTSLQGERVLVTGGAGFIGSHLVEALMREGYRVRVVDNLSTGRRSNLDHLEGQYEWLERSPWSVAAGAPKNTHDNTIYMNIRYTLPGSMPNF